MWTSIFITKVTVFGMSDAGTIICPCLTLPEQKSIGKWGQKCKAYLRKHRHELYNAFQSDVFSLTASLTNILRKLINRRSMGYAPILLIFKLTLHIQREK